MTLVTEKGSRLSSTVVGEEKYRKHTCMNNDQDYGCRSYTCRVGSIETAHLMYCFGKTQEAIHVYRTIIMYP